MEYAESAYNEMIEHGCKPEQARDILPLDLACDIVVTYNFRQWKWVLRQRMSPAAHPKIRELITKARDLLVSISPTVFTQGDA
jgi:thymidylate synthase (FAD)